MTTTTSSIAYGAYTPIPSASRPLRVDIRGGFSPVPITIPIPEGDDISLQEICTQVLTKAGLDPSEFSVSFYVHSSEGGYGGFFQPIDDLTANLSSLNRGLWSYPPHIRIHKKIPSVPAFPKKTAMIIAALAVCILGIIALINPDLYAFSIKGVPLSAGIGGGLVLLAIAALARYYIKRSRAQRALTSYQASYLSRAERLDILARSIINTFSHDLRSCVEDREGSYLSSQEEYYHGTTDGGFSTTAGGAGFQMSYLGSERTPATGLVLGAGAYFAYSRDLAVRYTYDHSLLQVTDYPAPSAAIISARLAPRRVAVISDFSRWETFRTHLVDHIQTFSKTHLGHPDIYDVEGNHDISTPSLYNVIVRNLFLDEGFDAAILSEPNERARGIICPYATNEIDARTIVMFYPEHADGQVHILSSPPPPRTPFGQLPHFMAET